MIMIATTIRISNAPTFFAPEEISYITRQNGKFFYIPLWIQYKIEFQKQFRRSYVYFHLERTKLYEH